MRLRLTNKSEGPMKSKVNTVDLSARYQKALRHYLSHEKLSSLTTARKLGAQAADLGMTTLELAQAHEQILRTLFPRTTQSRSHKRSFMQAKLFFTETNSSIEKTHTATQTKEGHVRRLAKTLVKRTAESKASHQRLKTGIINRKKAEAALVKSSESHAKLIIISNRLRNLLRNQTHAILVSQEKERKKTSQGLQDKIAQALLGINIELLALKVSDKASALRFSKEIDSLKRCVNLKTGNKQARH
jgi:signal transduction histidine kinase